jgi:hypothetical protein
VAVRIVHVQQTPHTPPADPSYDIIDAGRYGEAEGGAHVLHSLRRDQVGDWLARQGMKYSAIERTIADLRTEDSVEVQLPLRAGPRIVRAWFDTVINPLVESLQAEEILLGRRNWTFTFRPPRLDLLRPLREYLPNEALANLDQLLRASDESLEDGVENHDAALARLYEAIISVHSMLVDNAEFRGLCDGLLSREHLSELGIGNPDEIFGAYPFSERYNLVAQNVVNHMGLLSPHYTTAKFWNRHRLALLQILERPEVHGQYSRAVALGEELAAATRSLHSDLCELRDGLSLQYDIPLVAGAR